jgi:PAS domain S-box-containing protein
VANARKTSGGTATTLRRKHMIKRDVAALPITDVQRLVYELQFHQIELELQNEELRRAQMELQAARDRYQDLYDSAPTGYLTLNPKGVILEANLPVCTLLGINRKDLLGKSIIGFVTAKDQPMFLSHIREVFKTGARQACDVDLVQTGDVPVSIQFESVAVQDQAGQPTCVLTSLLDITERTHAAAAFQAWRQGLERQRNLEERVWLGHDLHDGILQSLYAIGLGLEVGKANLSGASNKAAVALTHGIDELNSVMRDVRSFIGKLKATDLSDTALPSRDLPTSLRTMAGILARLHGRRVRVSVDPAVASALSQMQSAQICNLAKEALSNSFRHARATGVHLSLRQVKDSIRLTVRDNGTGLRRKDAKGDGQGFISMTARARKLGGTLSVHSKPAQGTRVVVDLPKKIRIPVVNP